MGCTGSSKATGALPQLPQQEVVNTVPVAASTPKHSDATAIKIGLVWDKSSIDVQRCGGPKSSQWSLKAKFQAETPCDFIVYYHCTGNMVDGEFQHRPQQSCPPPRTAQHFAAGAHTVSLDGADAIDLQRWPLDAFWKYRSTRGDIIPIAFLLKGTDGTQSMLHFGLHNDGADLKAVLLRQLVIVDGHEYTLQEVYGLAEIGKESSHDESTVGQPCVICLSSARNTAILPCHHLCVCGECAQEIMVGIEGKAGMCPICRGVVSELQIFELKK